MTPYQLICTVRTPNWSVSFDQPRLSRVLCSRLLSVLRERKTPTNPSQSLTPHYDTSTAASTHQPPQRTYPPASTRLSSLSSDKASFGEAAPPKKKHSTNADTGTPTQKRPKLATAQRRKHAHLTETAFSHHKSTKQPSHVRTTAPLKHISDLPKIDCKTRYKNCTASFRHTKHRNSIELSKHI